MEALFVAPFVECPRSHIDLEARRPISQLQASYTPTLAREEDYGRLLRSLPLMDEKS